MRPPVDLKTGIARSDSFDRRGGSTEGITCDHISFSWHDDLGVPHEVLRDVSISTRLGEFVSIVGPSGCGKTTLLRILAGLIVPDNGCASIHGKVIDAPIPEVGIVFQDYGLFPWLTVAGNAEFAMKVRGVERAERRKRTTELLSRVGLSQSSSKYPHELSGGMRQRAAIARALATDAECLLMDEPFAALDYQTRRFMQDYLIEVWAQFKKTIVFVTHHLDEAISLSDRIVMLSSRPGRVLEIISVAMPRPRDIATNEFNQIRRKLTGHLEEQARNAFADVDK